MRKAQKQEILNLIDSMHQIHEEIKKALEQNNLMLAQDMISGIQESAISLGETIEKSEGEGHRTVSYIEAYCELLFLVFEDINKNDLHVNKTHKALRKQLIKIENSVKNDIIVRKEVVFFPYKASMWDSLESIYLAAREDPDCDVYCVPIPYYTLNPDRSFGKMHYEGNVCPDGTPMEYPEDIEITDWQEYNFEERKPDVIYIHNPYDNCNLVTSVHPRYYSINLKKNTDCLVYVPYYSTSGGMSGAQSCCPAYIYADYIVIQSPQFRKFFDKNIPDEKFLPFGSPKVDRVIRKCQNPPEPPAEWKEKMAGRRVYFYNTSISGMLTDTDNFLKKMNYVFECFEEREDVCLLWRPHPLLESTFDSMRPEYRQTYDTLKKNFCENSIGIYDTTPDIENSIALSNAYIGDAGTSVTSLFGVVGKPMFILDNRIHSEPDEDSWRKTINMQFDCLEQNRFVITQNNQLYVSEGEMYDYHYFCDLSDSKRKEYSTICEINGKKYACPANTQEILLIGKEGVERRISLKKEVLMGRAFIEARKYDRFLILLPLYYPAIVRYDTETEECRYFTDYIDVLVTDKEGQKVSGASLVHRGTLYVASHTENIVYTLNLETGKAQLVTIQAKSGTCYNMMAEYLDYIWMLPCKGRTVVRWNPQTGDVKEYTGFPKEFTCVNPRLNQECEEYPFSSMAFHEDDLYLTPRWANMYLRLNIRTGQFTGWKPPFEERQQENCMLRNKAYFLWNQLVDERGWIKIYSNVNKKLYHINLKTNECEEIEIKFDPKELEKQEQGFGEYSGTLKYACKESVFNSLGRFIEGTTAGNPFDKENQLAVYRELMANGDGSCGRKIYEYIKSQD